ncbi:MAG: hypothetical protein ACRDPG_12105 [Nocardioidaceae bacterium]
MRGGSQAERLWARTGDNPAGPSHAAPGSGLAGGPINGFAFLGVAIASFGGPLALAALYAPAALDNVGSATGLVAAVGSAVFVVPMLVWLRASRRVAGPGGLYSIVEAAAGRRTALVHAVLWAFSYLLYVVYTPALIVYDILPQAAPGVRSYQSLLTILLPIGLAAAMIAGRTAMLTVIGILAAGQLVLVVVLAVVTLGHDAPVGSFTSTVATGDATSAAGQIALLYVCGSLPLYLGGEVARPARMLPRGIGVGYAVAAVGVVAAVFPLSENPAFLHAPIPGMSVAEVFAGHGFALAIGFGVAASIAGVVLVEMLAVSRLAHAVTRWPTRRFSWLLAAALVASGPVTLANPTAVYQDLLKPSLVALWLSQLIVFVVSPALFRGPGGRRLTTLALAVGGSAFALLGLYSALGSAGS